MQMLVSYLISFRSFCRLTPDARPRLMDGSLHSFEEGKGVALLSRLLAGGRGHDHSSNVVSQLQAILFQLSHKSNQALPAVTGGGFVIDLLQFSVPRRRASTGPGQQQLE